MEHELAGLIVTCLSEGEVRPETELMRCDAVVMARFEIMLAKTMLAKSPGRSLTTTELCEGAPRLASDAGRSLRAVPWR